MNSFDADDLALALATASDFLDSAKSKLHHFEARHSDAVRRIEILSSDRAKLSYAALSSDNESLQTQLHDLNQASLSATLEVENLASAVAEAKMRVAEAEQAHALALTRMKASETLRDLAALKQLSTELDACLGDFCVVFGKFQALAYATLTATGRDTASTGGIIRVMSQRALKTALAVHHQTFDLDRLVLKDRTSFRTATDNWANAVQSYCHSKLGPKTAEAAE
jgi:hypothetical protein